MHAAHSALVGVHDARLVAGSVVIAMLSAYAALDFAGRVTATRGHARLAWLLGGATAMGTGIWSMHYVGMLAFSPPIPVSYHWPTVVASLAAAIGAAGAALLVVSRPAMSRTSLAVGSATMGAGIAARRIAVGPDQRGDARWQ